MRTFFVEGPKGGKGMRYGVKVIYKWTAGERDFYEESILLVGAGSFDEAFERAEARARVRTRRRYVNLYGEEVALSVAAWGDAFEIAPGEDDDVQEVFSAIYRNRAGLSEAEYLASRVESCDAEAMLPLRDAALGQVRRKGDP